MPAKSDTNAILKVPHNAEGREFLRQFHRYLNKDKYTTKARGRKPNWAKMIQTGFYGSSHHDHGDYTLAVCDEAHIYLFAKTARNDWGGRGFVGANASTAKAYVRELQKSRELRDALEDIYKAIYALPLIKAIKIIEKISAKHTYDYIKDKCQEQVKNIIQSNKDKGLKIDSL